MLSAALERGLAPGRTRPVRGPFPRRSGWINGERYRASTSRSPSLRIKPYLQGVSPQVVILLLSGRVTIHSGYGLQGQCSRLGVPGS